MASKPTSLVAIYPGSFDPITNGHLDLIERAGRLVDKLVVAILRNEKKQPLFSVEDRIEMLSEVVVGTRMWKWTSSTDCWWTTRSQKQATLIIPGNSGNFGLRARIADGADESATQAGNRYGVHDVQRGPFLHQFAPGKRSNSTGREYHRTSAPSR